MNVHDPLKMDYIDIVETLIKLWVNILKWFFLQ